MIAVGDLVSFNDARWMVVSIDSTTRMAKLTRGRVGEAVDAPVGSDDLIRIANPALEWPVVQYGLKSAHGRVQAIHVTRGRTTYELEPLIDWVPSSFQRPSPIFFNPGAKLRIGEVLVATHVDGVKGRISITSSFGTVKARATPKPKPVEPTVFDLVMGDDWDD